MQHLNHLSSVEFGERLTSGTLVLHIGPYIFNLHSNLPLVASGINALYGDFRLADAPDFIDFNVAIKTHGLMQRLRGEVEFFFDEHNPFDSIPIDQAYAFFEWGMNWCVSVHTNEYLKLHAGVVAVWSQICLHVSDDTLVCFLAYRSKNCA